MSEVPSPINPEKAEILDDNARKFIVASPLTTEFLKANGAISYLLICDWINTGTNDEEKLVYKKFENNETQILLISKATLDGNRTSKKENITSERYMQLLEQSKINVKKIRNEFEYVQDDATYSIKYDEFEGDELRVLEVDAPTDDVRALFKPDNLPFALSEITGDISYYGYRVASHVKNHR